MKIVRTFFFYKMAWMPLIRSFLPLLVLLVFTNAAAVAALIPIHGFQDAPSHSSSNILVAQQTLNSSANKRDSNLARVKQPMIEGAENVRSAPSALGDEYWASNFSNSGVSGEVKAAAKDSNNNIYVGGSFITAGGVIANYIAKWNGSAWSALGEGMNGAVYALAVDGANNLYAGGVFTTAGGVSANAIAKWNGTSWSALGDGMSGGYPLTPYVSALAIDSSNNVYAGGYFSHAGDISAPGLAKWNGSAWSAVGSLIFGDIRALVVDNNGNLFAAGGSFGIEKWNGSAWSEIGRVDSSNSMRALAVDSNNNLYLGGIFNQICGNIYCNSGNITVNGLAKWNGSVWSAVGSGFSGGIYALAVDSNNNLYTGGAYYISGGANGTGVAKWNGSSWSALGTGMTVGGGYYSPYVNAVVVDSANNIFAGGYFTTAGSVNAIHIAKWNGNAWLQLGIGNGMADGIAALAADGNGNIYASGYFFAAGNTSANYVAKWNGSAWAPLANGRAFNTYALAVDSNNNVYAGGALLFDGIYYYNEITRWNGTAWSGVNANMDSAVAALTTDSNNNLYAGGDFQTADGISYANRIAKWNGSAWSTLGNGLNGNVYSLAMDHNNNLYAGGGFTQICGNTFCTASAGTVNYIAKWDGNNWSALGSGMNGGGYYPFVTALAVDGLNNLYAGGVFTNTGGMSANYIAKWNGSAWSALGSGMNGRVNALAVDNDNNLYAGGDFTTAGGVSVNHIAKWNGSSWSALGSGTNSSVSALLVRGNKLYAGGFFTTAGGKVSDYIGIYSIPKYLFLPLIVR